MVTQPSNTKKKSVGGWVKKKDRATIEPKLRTQCSEEEDERKGES